MDWLVIGPVFILLAVCCILLWYSAKKIREHICRLRAETEDLTKSMDDLDSDMAEIREQIWKLSETLYEDDEEDEDVGSDE